MTVHNTWEDRIRARLALALKSAQQLHAGRRHDREAVVNELQRTFDGISFVVMLFPELAHDFTIATGRDVIAGRLAEIELDRDKAERDERDQSDGDDDDHARA